MRISFLLAIVGSLWIGTMSHASTVPSGPMPETTPEFVEKGREIYMGRCSFCHGLTGDGEGPAAKYLDPRPRDFTLAIYKFRTTQSGGLPQDSDLFRTVSRGLPGTAMQAFDRSLIKNGLTEEERWAVIAYIKTFAMEFDDPEFFPPNPKNIVSLPATRPAYSPEVVAKGKEIFLKAKCWECHGKEGRGNGQKAFDRKDDWGFPIRIRNVTLPWKIKGGSEVEDIYMRFSTGVNGTPMPSFARALNDEDRWYLANFIKSLQHDLTSHAALKALKVIGDIPATPDDEMWNDAEPMDVRLTGQVVAAPRWQNPSIELVTVQAAFNETDISFRMTWDDPFKDVTHDAAQEIDTSDIAKVGAFNSYVEAMDMMPRALETFRDSVALQFPVKAPEGSKKPHFFRGNSSNPVNLWTWQAEKDAAVESIARGWKQQPKPQKAEAQQITSEASWADGRWTVVMKRPLLTEDKNDVQFTPGVFIPMALNAWDGSNGEHNNIMSLSTWYSVVLEQPAPMSLYLKVLLAILGAVAIEVWLVRKAKTARQSD